MLDKTFWESLKEQLRNATQSRSGVEQRPQRPKTQPSGETAPAIASSNPGTSTTPFIEPPDPPVRLRWTGPFAQSSSFEASRESRFVRQVPRNDGIRADLLEDGVATNEADIWLGLDFGTSSVKAVIRDATLRQAYAVPFSAEQQNRYLLPTRVFESASGFSFELEGVCIEDLKLALMQPRNQVSDRSLEQACAFLALTIRHCRGWFLSAYAPRYHGHVLNWHINVGLPARAYEDTDLVERFRRVAWGAASLASDAERRAITREATVQWLSRYDSVGASTTDGGAVPVDDILVIPEISAQIAGLVEARHWDILHRPHFVLVDIGAGTVDSAMFAIVKDQKNGRNRFVFYSSDVHPFGVINLHRTRTNWLRLALGNEKPRKNDALDYIDRICRLAYRYSVFPESVETYLDGAMLEPLSELGTIDDRFFKDCILFQVRTCIDQARMSQKLQRESLQNLPMIVSGGGSRMTFYGKLPKSVNHLWRGMLTVQEERMTLPRGLEAPGLAVADSDRLSVAYGLSLPDVGTIVRKADIPPPPEAPRWNLGFSYVSKDEV